MSGSSSTSTLWTFLARKESVKRSAGRLGRSYVLDADGLQGRNVTSVSLERDNRLNVGVFEKTEDGELFCLLEDMVFGITNISVEGMEDEPHLKPLYFTLLKYSGDDLTVWDINREEDVPRDLSKLEPGAQLYVSVDRVNEERDLPPALVFRLCESQSLSENLE